MTASCLRSTRRLRSPSITTHRRQPPRSRGSALLLDQTRPATLRRWQRRVRDLLDAGAEVHNRCPSLLHRATREAIDTYDAEHPEREQWFFVRCGYTGRPGCREPNGVKRRGPRAAPARRLRSSRTRAARRPRAGRCVPSGSRLRPGSCDADARRSTATSPPTTRTLADGRRSVQPVDHPTTSRPPMHATGGR